MDKVLNDLVAFLQDYVSKNPGCKKDAIAQAAASQFKLERKNRSLLAAISQLDLQLPNSPHSQIGFSHSQRCAPRDHLPMILCIVRRRDVELLLVNSTFLKKASHASHKLRIDNVRGGLLGADIIREYEGIKNIPANFSALFSIHSEFTWNENLARLVKATNNISPTGIRFLPTAAECEKILIAADLSAELSRHPEYLAIGVELSRVAENQKDSILQAAKIDNVNERGNTIEQIFTHGANVHSLEDLRFPLKTGATVFVDVKTKLLAKRSKPKGYNIDKLLITLAQGKTVFSFFFLGIDLKSRTLQTRLVSILDRTVLAATKEQFHWAGRNSRGVTQLTGDLSGLFAPSFQEQVDVSEAKAFLQRLIDIEVLPGPPSD